LRKQRWATFLAHCWPISSSLVTIS